MPLPTKPVAASSPKHVSEYFPSVLLTQSLFALNLLYSKGMCSGRKSAISHVFHSEFTLHFRGEIPPTFKVCWAASSERLPPGIQAVARPDEQKNEFFDKVNWLSRSFKGRVHTKARFEVACPSLIMVLMRIFKIWSVSWARGFLFVHIHIFPSTLSIR
jgi:hypothetical protein